MTRTVEIPQERWPSFLKMLNQMAEGRPVRLELANRELGDQELGKLLPLREIGLETKGSDRGELFISLGDDRAELNHSVAKPTGIAVGLNDAGEAQWIAIDEHGEMTTILHFEQLPALEGEYGITP